MQGELQFESAEPIEQAAPAARRAEIWNPNAAACWSLIFTPAFGSYLQMLNWRALGEEEEARGAQVWFYVSIGMLALVMMTDLLFTDPKMAENASRGMGFVFLLIWYFFAGREQTIYVKERFNKDYDKKPWGKALLYGVGGVFAYFLFVLLFSGIRIAVTNKLCTQGLPPMLKS